MNATPYLDWVDDVVDRISKSKLGSSCIDSPYDLSCSYGICRCAVCFPGEGDMASLSMATLYVVDE